MFELEKITRENIKKLKPYSSARDEYKGKEGIFLDANENAFGAPGNFFSSIEDDKWDKIAKINRYPDPLQLDLKDKISKIKGLPIQNIFLGNGSDEAIDILFRAFCNPGVDNIIVCPPTYGMYEVSANINDITILNVPLIEETFQLNVSKIIETINDQTKLIFMCSPNNPTGNSMEWESIKNILEKFKGIIVVDEAYINFSKSRSLISELLNYPNLVVLQTLSKAWGLAGLRLGMAFASEPIIDIFNKIKPPYNINVLTQIVAEDALNDVEQVNSWIREIVIERESLKIELKKLPFVSKVYDSEANFILFKTNNATELYNYLANNKIITRNRNTVLLCEGCIRVTVGVEKENRLLIKKLLEYRT